jgi:hypothetical protein
VKILGFKYVPNLKLKGLKIQKIKFKPPPREPLNKFNNVIIKTKSFLKRKSQNNIFTNVAWLFEFCNKKWFRK